MRCATCKKNNEWYGIDRPGFIAAGPLAPMTGFPCPDCHGTGEAPFWVVYPEAS